MHFYKNRPDYTSVPVIPEPGTTDVDGQSVVYRTAGTPDNLRLQHIRDQLKPYRASIAAIRQEKSGDEFVQRDRAFRIERISNEEAVRACELIAENHDFAGWAAL